MASYPHDHLQEAFSHPHPHSHSHCHDYSNANKDYFDGIAAERYDNQPGATELARRLGEAMIEKFPLAFDESKTVAMDYACGTGR